MRGYEKQPDEARRQQGARRRAARRRSKGTPSAAPRSRRRRAQVWEEAKAQIALFNAGVYREGLGQYKQALKDREHYLELWPEAKDAETVFLSIADLHERMSATARPSSTSRRRARDQARLEQGARRRGPHRSSIEDQKLKSPRAIAPACYKTILEYYEKLYRDAEGRPRAGREATGGPRPVREERGAVPVLRPPEAPLGQGPPSGEGFRRHIKDKGKSLDEVKRLYTRLVALGAAEPAICALRQIGLAYENMADRWPTRPCSARSRPRPRRS